MASYLYPADQCPAPVRPIALLDPANATGTGSGGPTWDTINQGQQVGLALAVNRHSTRGDLTGRWGGGAAAVATGLDLAPGTGLTLNVAAGQAMIDGPVTLSASTPLALSNNQSRIFIWLTQAGVPTPVNGSMAPPATACAYLGSASTKNGVITQVDYSGRMELRGGIPQRTTSDQGTPTDAPPAGFSFLHRGGGGSGILWLWDGVRYATVDEDLGRKFRILLVAFADQYWCPDGLEDDLALGQAEA